MKSESTYPCILVQRSHTCSKAPQWLPLTIFHAPEPELWSRCTPSINTLHRGRSIHLWGKKKTKQHSLGQLLPWLPLSFSSISCTASSIESCLSISSFRFNSRSQGQGPVYCVYSLLPDLTHGCVFLASPPDIHPAYVWSYKSFSLFLLCVLFYLGVADTQLHISELDDVIRLVRLWNHHLQDNEHIQDPPPNSSLCLCKPSLHFSLHGEGTTSVLWL